MGDTLFSLDNPPLSRSSEILSQRDRESEIWKHRRKIDIFMNTRIITRI
jgi:hypothetical protein